MTQRDANYYATDIWASILESIRFMEPVKVIRYGIDGKVIMKFSLTRWR